ncbi:MAG: hypothetical protein F6K31_07205 [Symploca sp. SIO2G7]|nr:hypothetical protein [Symploca sp. SIO2G7]
MSLDKFRKQERWNTGAVLFLGTIGIFTLGGALYGRQTMLIEYCFKPSDDPQFCTSDKRYIMPAHEFEKLVNAPASNPKSQIPNKAKALRIIKPTNPYKPLWGFISTSAFGLAYLLNQARVRKLLEFMPQYRLEVKQSWLFGKINAINQARKVEYAANLDWELWQFSAERAARAKQLSMLSPEEIALYQEQARLEAIQAAEQAIAEATGASAGALPHGNPGTVDEITNPTDKITGSPSTKEELLKALRQECPALLGLVKSHPIRCVGVQRSGKTTMAKKLALLRMVLLPDHQVIASTPHYEPTNAYPDVFQIVGIKNGKRDYPAIRTQWYGLAERVKDGTVSSITTIWDEFGLMDQVVEPEDLTKVLTSTLRETMKFGEYPVFIVHGETQAFLPGSKGLVKVFLSGTVRVETIGEKVIDEDGLETIKGTGKFKVKELDGSRAEGKIPEWMTEEFLLNLVGFKKGSAEPAERSAPNTEPEEVQTLNVLLDKAFSNSEPREPAEPFDPFSSEITAEEKGFAIGFRRSAMPKDEIILKLWGTKKGGSKGYQAAKKRLEQILFDAGVD